MMAALSRGQRGCFLALGCLPWLSEALQTVLCWRLRSSQERPSHPQLRTRVQVPPAPPSRAGSRPPTHKAKGQRWELRPGFVLTRGLDMEHLYRPRHPAPQVPFHFRNGS